MSTAVLTAVDHGDEARLVAALEGRAGVTIVRRCADVAELLSVAAARVADVALVSASFPGIDREVVRALAGHGVSVIGVTHRRDEHSERTLRQLGVRAVVPPDADPDELVATIRGSADDPLGPGGSGDPPWAPASSAESAVTRSAGWEPPGVAVLDVGSGLDLIDRRGPAPDSPPRGPAPGREPSDEPHAARPEAPSSRLPVEPMRGTVVALWGPIGSAGRTTIAVTLAAALAARSVPVLLVDADTHGASIAQVLGLIDEAPGVAAAARLSDQGSLDLVALSRVAPEVTPRLRVLTGLPRADRWPEVRAGAMTDVLGVARLLAQVVVVDCGFSLEDDEDLSYDTAAPRRNGATLAALEAADVILAVGAADPVGLQRLVRGVRELDAREVVNPWVVVNKVRSGTAGSQPERSIREVLQRFSGLDEVDFLPWAPAECDAALWSGQSLVEAAPAAPLTTAITGLAERVLRVALPGHTRAARRGG